MKNPMTREEFSQFLEAIHFHERFPSIQAFSYSVHVSGQEYEKTLREYNLVPQEQKIQESAFYAPIVLTSKDTGVNARILGTDNLKENNRKVALEYSRDANMPVLSQAITLRQIPE
jgi:CHASE1-domain containing sensor protein